jgi:hypothetical protein
MEVKLHAFLTSALDGCVWSAFSSGRFTSEGRPRYQLDRRWAGLAAVWTRWRREKFPALARIPLGPARPRSDCSKPLVRNVGVEMADCVLSIEYVGLFVGVCSAPLIRVRYMCSSVRTASLICLCLVSKAYFYNNKCYGDT